jgi:hypothetical protein
MAALALIVGGTTGHFLLFAVIVFFVVDRLLASVHGCLELHDRWKRRVR